MNPGTSRVWTCARCGVAASLSDSEMAPLPDAWEVCSDGTFCLGCRRHRAGEEAVDSAPAATDRDARARLRRTALIEFEVRRGPDKTNGSIAKSCRSSIAVVAATRQRLGDRRGS